jgi:hypothetical protein
MSINRLFSTVGAGSPGGGGSSVDSLVFGASEIDLILDSGIVTLTEDTIFRYIILTNTGRLNTAGFRYGASILCDISGSTVEDAIGWVGNPGQTSGTPGSGTSGALVLPDGTLGGSGGGINGYGGSGGGFVGYPGHTDGVILTSHNGGDGGAGGAGGSYGSPNPAGGAGGLGVATAGGQLVLRVSDIASVPAGLLRGGGRGGGGGGGQMIRRRSSTANMQAAGGSGSQTVTIR